MDHKLDEAWWDKERKKLQRRFNGSEFLHGEERFRSKDYLKFIESSKPEKENLYVKLCHSFQKFQIKPDKATNVKLTNAINLLEWDITPGQCMTTGIFLAIVLAIPSFLVFLFKISLILKLAAFSIPLIALYVGMTYPHIKALEKIVKGSEDLIFCILYMIIYTYSSPNLEGAVIFAATNLEGPISKDLKKVLWNVEVGNQINVDRSLSDYIARWEPYNRDFLESVQLIKGAMREPSDQKRNEMLHASSETILQGTKEKMKHYSQDLKMPVTILNGFGILLPVLGMIALPLASIFLESTIKLSHLILFYDIVLPLILYTVMIRVLIKRPPTTSVQPLNQGALPPKGKFTIKLGKKHIKIPALVPAILIFVALATPGLISLIQNPMLQEPSIANMSRSLFIVLGLGLGIGTYFFIGYKQRYEKQKQLEIIEAQFPVALFELGHRLADGKPIEAALDSAAYAMKNLSISGFFRIISNNIKRVNMVFRDSIFDKELGAIRKYPSKLIETVMKAIVDAARRGTKVVSGTMLTIASYLQNLHNTQEEISDLMEESTTTMKFVGFMLAPVIAGVAVSMTQIMINALTILKEKFADVGEIGAGGADTGMGTNLLSGFIKLESMIPPHILQLVIGIYIIEILLIIGLFYTRVKQGENKTVERMNMGKLLLIGSIVYVITTLLISAIFGGILKTII